MNTPCASRHVRRVRAKRNTSTADLASTAPFNSEILSVGPEAHRSVLPNPLRSRLLRDVGRELLKAGILRRPRGGQRLLPHGHDVAHPFLKD